MTKDNARPAAKKVLKNTGSPADREPSEVLSSMLKALPRVTTTQHMGHTSFCVGKKVFAFTRNQGVALKLPRTRAEHLVLHTKAEFLAMGKRVMKEWIVLQHDGADDYLADLDLFVEARNFVATAPTKR